MCRRQVVQAKELVSSGPTNGFFYASAAVAGYLTGPQRLLASCGLMRRTSLVRRVFRTLCSWKSPVGELKQSSIEAVSDCQGDVNGRCRKAHGDWRRSNGCD